MVFQNLEITYILFTHIKMLTGVLPCPTPTPKVKRKMGGHITDFQQQHQSMFITEYLTFPL